MILGCYRALTALSGPILGPYLRRRMARGKEDPARFGERLGQPGLARPQGRLVWLHGASVGESLTLLPLIQRLVRRPGWTVLLTTGTVTSARLMADRLPAGAIHQFVPVDHPRYVRSFLDHWRPDLVLWTESDFWPNLLTQCAARSVPMVLLQGRISARSFGKWRYLPSFIGRLLGGFQLILAQTPDDADRLRRLGGGDVRYVGNLKMAVPPLPVDQDDLRHMQSLLGDRPVWMAASTHAGEEVMAARIHQALVVRHPDLLTIIAPRHPERGAAIADQISALGLDVARRSLGQGPQGGLYLADTMGELGLFYRLSPVVFVGKSLLAKGGQNPFEPALLGAAVLFGPHMDNFPLIAPHMVQAGAAQSVADGDQLQAAIDVLLSDPAMVADRRGKSLAWASGEAGVIDAVDAALTPILERVEAPYARP